MKRQKDECSVKKGAIYLVSIDNRNYRMWVTFLFLMTSIQCFVYLSREVSFFHAMFTYVVGGKENIMILFREMSVKV